METEGDSPAVPKEANDATVDDSNISLWSENSSGNESDSDQEV
jgi:hypothetical protein